MYIFENKTRTRKFCFFVRVFSSLQNKPTCWNCSSKKPNFKVPTLSQYKMSCFPPSLWIPPFVWRSFHHKFHCNSKLLSLTKHFRESGQAILFVRQTEFHSLTTDSAISKPWIVNCISLKCLIHFLEGGNIISDCKWQVPFPSFLRILFTTTGVSITCPRPQ